MVSAKSARVFSTRPFTMSATAVVAVVRVEGSTLLLAMVTRRAVSTRSVAPVMAPAICIAPLAATLCAVSTTRMSLPPACAILTSADTPLAARPMLRIPRNTPLAIGTTVSGMAASCRVSKALSQPSRFSPAIISATMWAAPVSVMAQVSRKSSYIVRTKLTCSAGFRVR